MRNIVLGLMAILGLMAAPVPAPAAEPAPVPAPAAEPAPVPAATTPAEEAEDLRRAEAEVAAAEAALDALRGVLKASAEAEAEAEEKVKAPEPAPAPAAEPAAEPTPAPAAEPAPEPTPCGSFAACRLEVEGLKAKVAEAHPSQRGGAVAAYLQALARLEHFLP